MARVKIHENKKMKNIHEFKFQLSITTNESQRKTNKIIIPLELMALCFSHPKLMETHFTEKLQFIRFDLVVRI